MSHAMKVTKMFLNALKLLINLIIEFLNDIKYVGGIQSVLLVVKATICYQFK